MIKKLKILVISGFISTILSVQSMADSYMTEEQVHNIAIEHGEKYGISPEFITSISFYESSYRPNAKNGSCKGLMQVSSKWHGDRMKRLDVENIYDPSGNILVATDYLWELFEEYEDPAIVLMVYNGDNKAFEEGYVSEYARDILSLSKELEGKYGKSDGGLKNDF